MKNFFLICMTIFYLGGVCMATIPHEEKVCVMANDVAYITPTMAGIDVPFTIVNHCSDVVEFIGISESIINANTSNFLPESKKAADVCEQLKHFALIAPFNVALSHSQSVKQKVPSRWYCNTLKPPLLAQSTHK